MIQPPEENFVKSRLDFDCSKWPSSLNIGPTGSATVGTNEFV